LGHRAFDRPITFPRGGSALIPPSFGGDFAFREPTSSDRRSLAPIAVLLFLGIYAAYLHGQMGCADSRWSIPTAVSLLDERNVDLDEFRPMLEANRYYATEKVGGHDLGIYPFGTSLLVAPVVAVIRPASSVALRLFPAIKAQMIREQLRWGCPLAGGEAVVDLHSWFERLIASGIVSLTAVLLFWTASEDLSPAGAAAVALVFAFGTPAWSSASRALWQHAPSMLVLTAALMLQRRASHFGALGILLGFAYVIRPTNSIPVVLMTIWVAYSHRRRTVEYVLGLSAVLVLFVIANYRVYGAPLSPYYHPGHWGHSVFVTEALLGTLISPGRGLFVYSPVLLFSIAGIVLKCRQGRFTSLDVALVACLVLHWVALAVAAPTWWAGFSYGPRFFADMLPYLAYFLIPFVAWATSAPGRPAAAGSFAAAVAVSVLMQAQGVFNQQALLWNAQPITIDADSPRLWSWRYPPFLAGLIASPFTIDLHAVPCSEAPGTPDALSLVSSRNHTVVAAWQPAAGAVALYVVESGSAPGRRDFPDREVADVAKRQILVSSVPSGTYYVRVRAKNACGVSPASNELRVVVE
jgi:hypothetical protein